MSQYAIRWYARHTEAGALQPTKAEPESLEVMKSGMLAESLSPDKRPIKKGHLSDLFLSNRVGSHHRHHVAGDGWMHLIT